MAGIMSFYKKRTADLIAATKAEPAAAPAESQGVERAQPACGCPDWFIQEDDSPHHAICPLYRHRAQAHYPRAQPVEGPREPLYRLKACDKCGKEFTYDYECHCGFGWHYVSAPVEGVERVTDDRPAETIPEDLKGHYKRAQDYAFQKKFYGYLVSEIIERTGRAETRVEVLEAALRGARKDVEYKRDHSQTAQGRKNAARTIEAIDAALAAPSGEKEKV